ncbi:MAG TPA: methyltransferase domain-containing protein [Devosiaceae bacterium]|jgi:ubiquinone/menaquinone biosynthesis C-methylase UbiE|nr:methyltransferase domain-containing protein [Devosiaceae bacterium]
MNEQQIHSKSFGVDPAENYERFFVPSIGAPMAEDLVAAADPQPGERVLDIACGTGVVTRLAARRVGASGSVTGLDITPRMLAVARSATPPDLSITWQEGDAESLPFPDSAFGVVLCQMGLQFVSGKLNALREMRRVLAAGGRALITVPGPRPALFAILIEALARHLGPQAAAFGDRVFSMYDVDEIRELMHSAGFRNVDVEARSGRLRLPPPADFLWQYIYSTPLAEPAAQAGDARRAALERDVCEQWQEFVVDGFLPLQVGVTTAAGLR